MLNTGYDVAGAEMTCPGEGQPLYGQDAQYQGAAPSDRDNADGTVTDNNTGLMWMKSDVLIGYWFECSNYCALDLGGHQDWRLPTRLELLSIVDFGRIPALKLPYFSGTNYLTWSSTIALAYGTSFHWFVGSHTGAAAVGHDNMSGLSRCVRP